MIPRDWEAPTPVLAVPGRERMDVWRVELPRQMTGQSWRRILAEEELMRAGRFAFEKDRAAYITTRRTLRTLLGRYLQIAPQEIRFVYSAFGKPALDPRCHDAALRFNVSHSHRFALLAFSSDADLGVDIEYGRGIQAADFAPMVCSTAELAALDRLPAVDYDPAFARLWTHKEALVKAIGCGLSLSLPAIEFAFTPAGSLQLVQGIPEIGSISEWSFYEPNAHPDYACALAVRSERIDVKLWDGNPVL